MTNLQELLSKPVWQMTGEEFIFLSKHASRQTETQPQPITDTERKMLIFRQNNSSCEPFYFFVVVCNKSPKVPGPDFYIT